MRADEGTAGIPIGRTPVYRIKHELPGNFGPNDAAYFFYCRLGFLGYRFHVETEWTDSGGERLGVRIGEESELLDSLDLAETSGCRR